MSHLYLIRDKDRNLRKLRNNPGQEEMKAVAMECLRLGLPINHMDLKARQVGATSWWTIFFLDDTLFTRNTVSYIVAQKNETLALIWGIVRLAYYNMPQELRPPSNEDTTRGLSFPGLNSTIKVSLKVESTTCHNLLVSEFAQCQRDDIEKTLAALPKNANVVFETVPDGVNHAEEKWKDKGDGATRIFHPWYKSPEYRLPVPKGIKVVRTESEVKFCDMALRRYGVDIDDEQIMWRRDKRRKLKSKFPEQFAEDEFSCFLASGNTYFNGAKIMALKDEAEAHLAERPPVSKTEELEVWEAPEHGHVYAAGADVAEGVEGDRSVLAILCVTCRKTAMRYMGRPGIDSFYRLLYEYGMAYKRALLAPERNNHGHAVLLGLRELDYPNLYVENPDTRLAPLKNTIKELKFGWLTNAESKPTMLDRLRIAVEGNSDEDETNFEPEFTVLDTEFLDEALGVREESRKISATGGKHDDLVMAYAIAFQMYLEVKGRTALADPRRVIMGDKRESAD